MFLRDFLEVVGTFYANVSLGEWVRAIGTYVIGGCECAVWSPHFPACVLQSLESLLFAPISLCCATQYLG
jgi:hypothetical protein